MDSDRVRDERDYMESRQVSAWEQVQALQAENERLRAEVKRREDDMLRLSELNGELASMLRIARENAVHQQRAINRYEAERAEAKEEYPEHLCDCGMGDATRRGLHDKTCAVHRG